MKEPMTAAQIDALLVAHRAGKSIEMNALGNNGAPGWIPVIGPNPTWTFRLMEYRIRDPYKTVALNPEYSAKIDPINKSIQVGCVHINRDKIYEIIGALNGSLSGI